MARVESVGKVELTQTDMNAMDSVQNFSSSYLLININIELHNTVTLPVTFIHLKFDISFWGKNIDSGIEEQDEEKIWRTSKRMMEKITQWGAS
jgi:hypothetical protein